VSSADSIGRYRLEATIGRGSMGEVFRAYDPELDRTVAIKTIRLDFSTLGDDPLEPVARFRHEARSAAGLQHPNIVTVFDYGDHDGLYYLVMEYVEGETLGQLLSAGPLGAREAAVVVQQTCEALRAAHAAGLIHRDIKPGNIMIDRSTGLVKVMDFGIARRETDGLTSDGAVIGTPRYMSPEQVKGGPVDGRSDLFSLGSVFYEILTGRKAFGGDNMATIAHRIVNEQPEGFEGIDEEMEEGYARVLRRALMKEPGERFQSAEEFRNAIEDYCLESSPTASQPVAASTPHDAGTEDQRPTDTSPREGAPEEGLAAGADVSGGVDLASGPFPPAPPTPGRDDPLFTAPRRGRRRGRGLPLGILAVVVVVAIGAWAWLRYGGGGGPGSFPAAATPADTVADDTAPAGVVDSTTTPPPVRLVVSVEPAFAAVTVDDSLSPDPEGTLELAPGAHRVHAEAAGYLAVDTLVELSADDSLALALRRAPPATGVLEVRASLPGQVSVDGSVRGAAPLTGLRLRPGAHAIVFTPQAGEALAEARQVSVQAGQTASVSFDITDALITVAIREPRWATVYAGSARLGDTPLIDYRLAARVHTLRVVRDGYRTLERLVNLAPGERLEWVDITLEPESGP
jgi:serine/threonine-protein kinase